MKRLAALVVVASCATFLGAAPPPVVPAFATLSLEQAQNRVVQRDVGVAQAQSTAMQYAADLHLAGTLAIPYLFGDYTLSPQAGNRGQSDGSVEQHLLTAGAGITLNDLLSSSDRIRSSAQDLLSAQRQVDAATLLARENAVRMYYAALSAMALQVFAQSNLASTLKDRAAARLRARTGESPQLDVMRADVAVEQARAQLALARAQATDAVETLAVAAGVSPASLARVVDVPVAAAPPLPVKAAVARALAERPEIAALLASIRAREANVGLARQSGLPAVTAQGGYAGGVDTGVPVRGPSATVHLNVPIASPEGANVQIAQAQLNAAQWQLVGARRTIALEVASAVRGALAAQVSARAADAARNAATRALRAVELGYREGYSSSLDVTDARRTYVQASVNALVADYARDESNALVEVLVP